MSERVRSLVRLKLMTDELRMRESTGQSMGLLDPADNLLDANPSGRILVIEDRLETVAWFASALSPRHLSHTRVPPMTVRGISLS